MNALPFNLCSLLRKTSQLKSEKKLVQEIMSSGSSEVFFARRCLVVSWCYICRKLSSRTWEWDYVAPKYTHKLIITLLCYNWLQATKETVVFLEIERNYVIRGRWWSNKDELCSYAIIHCKAYQYWLTITKVTSPFQAITLVHYAANFNYPLTMMPRNASPFNTQPYTL